MLDRIAYNQEGDTIINRKLRDKVVLITGGARGIGKTIATKFGKHGGVVVICDVNQVQGVTAVEELLQQGIQAFFFHADLSQKGIPQKMVQDVVRKWGRIDILINNARSGTRTSMLEENDESWEQGFSVTLKAAFFASQEAIRQMSRTGGGVIVSIGSVSSYLAGIESPSYHIAKAGLVQMTRYLAVHAGSDNIRINCVVPGFIVQEEHRKQFEENTNKQYRSIAAFCHPVGHPGKSDDIADAVLFLCSSQSTFITGQSLVVDGGLTIQEQSSLIYNFNKRTTSDME